MERTEGAPSAEELNAIIDTESDEAVLAGAGGVHSELLQVLDDKAIAQSLGISYKGSYEEDEVVVDPSSVQQRLLNLDEQIRAEDVGKSPEQLEEDAKARDKRAEHYFKNEKSRLQ